MYKGYRIGVVIPALNKAKCIEQVIIDNRSLLHKKDAIIDEITLCGHGSTASLAVLAGA